MSRRTSSIVGLVWTLTALVLMCCASLLQAADTPPTAASLKPGKTVRVLAIGNSFSQNAATYLPQLVESQGNKLVLAQAAVGGCSMEQHWGYVVKNEADPKDPEGRPYYMKGADGQQHSGASLKQLLQSEAWDVVTIQQHSWASMDLKTYRPYAKQLTDYIHQQAPQAKIWVHETWAYRIDNQLLNKTNTTQEKMYLGLHDAYATIAKETGAERIIPTGTAFQNARQDPRWQLDLQTDIDPKKLKYPELPRQLHALCDGWHWDTKTKPPTLAFDGKHCTPAGKYLAGVVWYETLFGDIQGESFVPKELLPQEAASLREIAHKTVHEGLQPKELKTGSTSAPAKR